GNYYTRSISWRGEVVDNGDGSVDFPEGPATPLGKEIDPQKAFERIFAGTDPEESNEQVETRMALGQSVLDTVLAQEAGLIPRLDADDQKKVDELFTGIRSLEQELQSAGSAANCE